MDTFNSTEFYGHSLSEDPKLRSTTKNYEFKYNCSDHLEKIINRVHMDRQNRNQHHILNRRRFPPTFESLCVPFSRNEESAVFKATTIDTRIGMLTSKETIVKVMSDAEIEAMISQAKLITEVLPTTTELPEPNILEKNTEPQVSNLESNIDSTFILDTKKQILPVEVLPILQPQWVEIRPIHKSMSNITYSEKKLHNLSEKLTQKETSSVLNLANEEFEELLSENISPDATSLDTFMSEDLVFRNDEENLEILTSLRIEPQLSICEREEIKNKVLQKVDTQVPEIDFSEAEISQNESDLKTEDDCECEEFEDSSRYDFGNTKRQIEPIVHIQPPENPHQRSLRTPRSIKIPASAKSPKVTPQAPKRRRPLSSIDRRMQKQLEVLKEEKNRIFCKMTTIQEQIIEIFDKMRMAILELSLPDGQIEKKLRERNAFEFSVRLSRNYLFPLGKMIEELRASSKEDFNSATTNEPCVRVCGVYGLLNQALQCYYKQLRHFFTDSVPKKLDIILNMVMDTTNTCLQKQIFDKRDTLIESLLMRCGTFLEFVMELPEQKKSARQDQKSGRRHIKKASPKWDLTMNLNNLNMYEPKLVSKKPKNKFKKKPGVNRLTHRSIGRKSVNSQEDIIALPKTDPVETQVQMIDPAESLQLIQSASEDQPEHELTKNVIQELQDITEDEVNQILKPLISNLDSILKKSDNPQAVQSLVDALNSQLLARCKQLKTDEAATENITQNSNTYQKEAKKGADYGWERMENRQKRRESKVKPTISCSSANPNVKEGSTKQTERYNSRFGRTDTKYDKQSLKPNNIDVVEAVAVTSTVADADADALDVDDSMKQKTRIRNNNVSSGAFLIERVVAKKPTPAPAAPASIRNGIPPPPLAISAVQLDEVIPTPIQMHSQAAATSTQKMTSHRSECLTSMPAMAIPVVDKFAVPAKQLEVRDGGYPNPKGYQRKTVDTSQRKVRDENDDDYDYEDANECCETGNRRNPGRKEQRLNYAKNSLYTFISYFEDAIPTSSISKLTNQHELQKVPEEEYCTESCTKLTPSSENRLPKSTQVSNSNFMATTASTETKQKPLDNHDIKMVLNEREEFIEKCKGDPLYSNQQFPEPWKILSKISETLTDEIVRTFQDDISFGEETYVKDFINMELQS